MADQKRPDQAHVYILKLWQEVLNDEHHHKQTEWRGKIQDVFNGETHYFRDWSTVVQFISDVLPELAQKRRKSRRRLERATGSPQAAATTRRRATAKE